MERQLKLFRNNELKRKKTPDAQVFPKSGLLGIDYEANSQSLWKISSEMAIKKYNPVFFKPTYIKNLLNYTKRNPIFSVNEIDFEYDIDSDLRLDEFLEAFYSDSQGKRNSQLSEQLMHILFSSNVKKVSLVYKKSQPATIINIYQGGLLHLSKRSGDIDYSGLDDMLQEVIH